MKVAGAWADLHIHTIVSDGMASPEDVVKYAAKTGLQVIAVTDHNTFLGSVIATRKVRELGRVLVVYGAEVRTYWGDILFLCPHPVRVTPDPLELRDVGDENNCVLIPAHPFDVVRKGIGSKVLLQGIWDGAECFNGGSDPLTNIMTYMILNRARLTCFANSDAHVLSMVGTARNFLDLTALTIDDVLECLRKGCVKPRPGYSVVGIRDRFVWGLKRKVNGIKGWPGASLTRKFDVEWR
ncbi:MAG: PHP domain-containing protein [Desulfurococcales archaeon]|nr:PHP domain-containing protein [Desulfurococcales archaeon]